MAELTQQQYEAIRLRAHEARQHFLSCLATNPECREAYRLWMLAEREAFDAGRARREAEAHE